MPFGENPKVGEGNQKTVFRMSEEESRRNDKSVWRKANKGFINLSCEVVFLCSRDWQNRKIQLLAVAGNLQGLLHFV